LKVSLAAETVMKPVIFYSKVFKQRLPREERMVQKTEKTGKNGKNGGQISCRKKPAKQ
jgi:hypothetical protein